MTQHGSDSSSNVPSSSPPRLPIEVAVQVEVAVHDDDDWESSLSHRSQGLGTSTASWDSNTDSQKRKLGMRLALPQSQLLLFSSANESGSCICPPAGPFFELITGVCRVHKEDYVVTTRFL